MNEKKCILPPYIHQIWFNFNNNSLSSEHNNIIAHTFAFANKYGFQYKLWSIEDAEKLIREHYPYFLNFFNTSIKFSIIKCDFFRFLLMYHFGGIYLDLDFFSIRSFNELFINDTFTFYDIDNNKIVDKSKCKILLFEEWFNSSNIYDKYSTNGSFHNGILCSIKKKEKLWMMLCKDIYMYGKNVKSNHDVWKVSGTNKLRNVFMQCNDPCYMFCKYFVSCPFRCISKVDDEIKECKSEQTIPNSLSSSRWMFYTFHFIENLHDPKSFFDNSVAVCVSLSSGSLWREEK